MSNDYRCLKKDLRVIFWKIQESDLKTVQKNFWRFECCLTCIQSVCFGFPVTKGNHIWAQLLFWQLPFPFSLRWLVLLLSKVILIFFLENCSAEIAPTKYSDRSEQGKVQKTFWCARVYSLFISQNSILQKNSPQNFNICTFYVCY